MTNTKALTRIASNVSTWTAVLTGLPVKEAMFGTNKNHVLTDEILNNLPRQKNTKVVNRITTKDQGWIRPWNIETEFKTIY